MRSQALFRYSLPLAAIITLFASIGSVAQGAVPVRIPGAGSRCINGSVDKIWLTLRRVIVEKNTDDKKVAVVINVQVKSPDANKPMAFPLMTEAKVAVYAKGQVSIPIEYTIIDGFKLKQITYSSSNVEMTLLNKSGKTKWRRALETLRSGSWSPLDAACIQFSLNKVSSSLIPVQANGSVSGL